MSKKWAVYGYGNSEYILSPNREPIRMLKSFQKYFGDELDYLYFIDISEPNLDKVQEICDENNIKLITGDVKEYYKKYADAKLHWPDAVYWYCEVPDLVVDTYDHLIKCDGDMMCINKFELEPFEIENAVVAAKEPSWYTPYDKYCPNAGFQIFNVKKYVEQNVKGLFRQSALRPDVFNSDTPALDRFVRDKLIDIRFVRADYNYLLFDVPQIHNLTLEDFENVKIVHFVSSKPYNLAPESEGTVKEHFAKIYLEY